MCSSDVFVALGLSFCDVLGVIGSSEILVTDIGFRVVFVSWMAGVVSGCRCFRCVVRVEKF